MKYNKLLKSHKTYGTNEEDIIKRQGYEKVLENVVIAPWWSHTIFEKFSTNIEKVGDKVYNISGEGFAFSFIELKNIGAPVIVDAVLNLGVTKCKKIIFIGSAGALNMDIKIGDLAIPTYSYCGVGACRYLNDNLEDDFETKDYPSNELLNDLIEILEDNNYKYHKVKNYSVDTIFAQFPHINHIKYMGSQTIEMETSSLFRCAKIINAEAVAIFCISDNTIENKSLYSGRSLEDKKSKHKARDEMIPEIVIKLLKKNN